MTDNIIDKTTRTTKDKIFLHTFAMNYPVLTYLKISSYCNKRQNLADLRQHFILRTTGFNDFFYCTLHELMLNMNIFCLFDIYWTLKSDLYIHDTSFIREPQ